MTDLSRRGHLKRTASAGFLAVPGIVLGSGIFSGSLRQAHGTCNTGANQDMDDTKRLQAVNPAENSIPNISQAVLVKGGDLLFLSGHLPLRDDGMLAGPDLADQLEQVFLNLKVTLGAAGADFSNVARITIYVRNLETADLPIIRAVRDRHIHLPRPPASALIGVAELYDPNVRVEIDAVAAVF